MMVFADNNWFDSLPASALVKQQDLLAHRIVPFSSATIGRRIKQNKFPSPIKLSDQITAFRVGDIRQWLDDPVGYGQTDREVD
jgi:prophage regulatory protein